MLLPSLRDFFHLGAPAPSAEALGYLQSNHPPYIDYMRPRCVEMARVLKKTGSFYYHCDWHAAHYMRIGNDYRLS